ncbi:hypothetical protein, partial [Bradyrhizobium sp. 145]|uniref:hypothetical protein n=1 Tax=Bradyrhizobium sp. 145 TaxID=2782621 RepID=UPI001FF94460
IMQGSKWNQPVGTLVESKSQVQIPLLCGPLRHVDRAGGNPNSPIAGLVDWPSNREASKAGVSLL